MRPLRLNNVRTCRRSAEKALFGAIVLFLLSSSLLLLSGCFATDTESDLNEGSADDIQDDLIVILHAGGGWEEMTHLNAQETFEYYYDMGYRYFEYDLRLTSDGRIIASHAWEHITVSNPQDLTYEEFKLIRLENGFTPVNEEWLIETIINYPDVRFVIDAKMDSTEGDAAVLARIEALESIFDVDISQNIIPEIFSKEMWDIVKEQTTFDRYFFSHYKVYYTASEMMYYFSDERIWGFALPTYTDGDIRSMLDEVKETKKIFVFTPTSAEEVIDAINMGADGVYLDFVTLLD